jgi:hypothetical protein
MVPAAALVWVCSLLPAALSAQLNSTNYHASDHGSVTHGAVAASTNSQTAIVNVWWDGHTYSSASYNGQGNVPGGFDFPCLWAEQPVVTQVGDTLYCSPAVSYQWYFNGSIINGATGSSVPATIPGSYVVVTTDSLGCSASSEAFPVGLEDPLMHLSDVILFPNPTAGVVTIAWNSALAGELLLEVMNLAGAIDRSLSVAIAPGSGSTTMDLSGLSNGVYLVRLRNASGGLVFKVVKQ